MTSILNKIFTAIQALTMIALFLAVPQSRSLAGGTGPEVQDGIPQSLSLDEAKQIAFARNWDLLAAKCGIDSATAQFIIAKEFPNPTASLATSKLGSHEAGTPVGNSVWERSYDTVAAVSQLIEVAGKRHDRQEAARAGLLGARAMFLDTKRVLGQGISKAYFAVLMAEATARNLNQSAGYLQHEAEIGREQLKAGDLSDANLKQLGSERQAVRIAGQGGRCDGRPKPYRRGSPHGRKKAQRQVDAS